MYTILNLFTSNKYKSVGEFEDCTKSTPHSKAGCGLSKLISTQLTNGHVYRCSKYIKRGKLFVCVNSSITCDYDNSTTYIPYGALGLTVETDDAFLKHISKGSSWININVLFFLRLRPIIRNTLAPSFYVYHILTADLLNVKRKRRTETYKDIISVINKESKYTRIAFGHDNISITHPLHSNEVSECNAPTGLTVDRLHTLLSSM